MANIDRKLRRQLQRMNGGLGGVSPAEPPLEAIPLLEFWYAYQAARELSLATEQEALRQYLERRVKTLVGKIISEKSASGG